MIIELNKNLEPSWQEYVFLSDKTSFTHTLEIRKVIKNSYGFKDYYLLSLNGDNKIKGVLPLFKVSKNNFLSLPFFDYAGIIADNNNVIKDFNDFLNKNFINQNKKIELRQLSSFSYDKSVSNLDNVTSLFYLSATPSEQWDKITGKKRNQIRTAQKYQPIFDYGKHYLNNFYNLYLRIMNYYGTPAHNLNFFKLILENFQDSNIMVTLFNKKVVSALLMIGFNKNLFIPWAVSDKKFNKYNFNDFLYWQTFQSAILHGYQQIDLGRSQKDSSILHFKNQWNSKTIQLYYYKLSKTPKKFISLKKSNLKYFSKIYRLLPLSVTKYLGPKLRKYLP